MKITFAIVFALILGCNCFAAEKPCDKKIVNFKEKNIESIQASVVKAIGSNNLAEVKKLIACDFMIAKQESDIGGFRRGKTLAPELLDILKNVKFKTKPEDEGSQMNLESEKPARDFGLVFRKDDSSGWYWAGVGIAEPKILSKLLKNSYQLDAGEDE